MSSALPATMKCIMASALGSIDEVLSMVYDAPKPMLQPKDAKSMIVKVEACSLSRGDSIMLSGACDKVLQPKAYPFIPGMDICGVVEEIAEGSDKFKVGDRVIATNGMLPVGGLAEFMSVPIKYAGKAPPDVEPFRAAALPNSPVTALHAVRAARVKEGDRVLVLGGAGGVGSSLLQLVKDAKASYLATTSTDKELCLSLGADCVIDYREKNWFEDEAYTAEPFDVVIDCVGWRDEWKSASANHVLKSGWKGGRYISIASTDDPQMHTIWQGVKMFVPELWRSGYTMINRFRPRYSLIICDVSEADLKDIAELVSAGRLKPVLDPASPFPFTVEGVKEAFRLQASKHAHGKVVVTMS